MDFATACQRLENHANQPSGPDSESLGLALWHLKRGSQTQVDIPALENDVIQCLRPVNSALNGETPSETNDTDKQMSIDRWLCYSMSLILDQLLEALLSPKLDTQQRKTIADIACRISYAWNAVLAGDIDELEDPLAPWREPKDS